MTSLELSFSKQDRLGSVVFMCNCFNLHFVHYICYIVQDSPPEGQGNRKYRALHRGQAKRNSPPLFFLKIYFKTKRELVSALTRYFVKQHQNIFSRLSILQIFKNQNALLNVNYDDRNGQISLLFLLKLSEMHLA